MNEPFVLDESIEVARPIDEVFSYISDFARIEEWDPAVRGAERLTEGLPRIGSEYRIDMNAGFSLNYRIVDLEPRRLMRMDVTSRVFDAEEEIHFQPTKRGTRVRYVARFHFPAPFDTLAKMFPMVMDRVGKSAMRGMEAALQDSFTTPRAALMVALGDYLIIPGLLRFTSLGYRGARKRWNPMSAWLGGRHIVITGATAGLGLAAAEQLAARGATLTLVARDPARGAEVVERLRAQSGNAEIRLEVADLETLAGVNSLADRLLAAGQAIHALVNNAGALFNPRRETSEGLEASFALLLLGPYLLTERLHPLLAAAQGARVVNVLSGGMYSQRVRVEDLESRRGKYSGAAAYARAKRGLMILTEEWAERWAGDGIVVNAMHPGWANTPGVRSALPAFHRLTNRVLRTPLQGADTIVWLAAATEAAGATGKFWLDREPHPSHILPGTRESAEERRALLDALSGYASAAQPAKAASRPRRTSTPASDKRSRSARSGASARARAT